MVVMHIGRIWPLGLAASWLAIATSASGAPGDTKIEAGIEVGAAAIAKAEEAAQAGNCTTALRLAGRQIAKPEFAALPEAQRATAYDVAAFCAGHSDKADLAYEYAIAGTALVQSSDWLWQVRLGQELRKDQLPAAVTSLEAMMNGRGAALNAIPTDWIFSLSRMVKNGGDAALRRRLLAVLADPAYEPDDTTGVTDFFRQDYAELLIDAGDHTAAAATVGQIARPSILRKLLVDSRFQALMSRDFDLRAAAEQNLERLRETAARRPQSLQSILEISNQLRQLGRPDEALTLLQAARPTGPDAIPYSDIDDQLIWWWNAIAWTQGMLGRYEEAVAALEQGMKMQEDRRPNVSQTINLAGTHLSFGHPDKALATLAALDSPEAAVSPYGELQKRGVRGCAAAMQGKEADARTELAYIRAHVDDDPDAPTELLLCLNDLDGAAAEFIRRLDDPKLRADALVELSDHDPPVATLPPDPSSSKLPALKARADVQAAIARAGGIRRFPLQAGGS
jgi:tetratricopeptide (TPR) repeat protein